LAVSVCSLQASMRRWLASKPAPVQGANNRIAPIIDGKRAFSYNESDTVRASAHNAAEAMLS